MKFRAIFFLFIAIFFLFFYIILLILIIKLTIIVVLILTLALLVLIIWYCPYVIFNLLCKSIFFYFYYKIGKNPILDYTFDNLEELNIFDIILLLIIIIISTYIGNKLFNWLKKVVLNLYNTTFNNNSINNTILQANIPREMGMLVLLGGSTNSSEASKFHARRALSLKQEENLLAIVVQKLDKEQPHPGGCSRWAAFQEHIGELRVGRFTSERWAFRNYYRDVVMKEIFADTNSVSSTVSSVVSSIL